MIKTHIFRGNFLKTAVSLRLPEGVLFGVQNYTEPKDGRELSVELDCVSSASISLPFLLSSSKSGLIMEFTARPRLLSKDAN